MTVKQIAAELGRTESTIRAIIKRGRAAKQIRIADWAGDVPKFGPGDAEDAEGGTTGERVLECLSSGGRATVKQLAERLGMERAAVDSAVRRLRKKPGKLHIADWERHIGQVGGCTTAIFAAGPGRDAPMPDFSNSQREAERRYAEKRRVRNRMVGQGKRGPNQTRRQRQAPAAGPFDMLLRG